MEMIRKDTWDEDEQKYMIHSFEVSLKPVEMLTMYDALKAFAKSDIAPADARVATRMVEGIKERWLT